MREVEKIGDEVRRVSGSWERDGCVGVEGKGCG